ncbi:MAG: sulfotransferase [Anaerolineales bacterium]|nr:sulfotransferase [Anaerolineales bacterium]
MANRSSPSQAPILVTGTHRTGTTWTGKMLAASGEAAYISEPLNVLHRPGVMLAPIPHWYTYIGAHNEADYLPALQDTLALRYHPWAELRSLRSRKDLLRMGRDGWIFLQGRLRRQRPLLKDPFAVFSIPWFIQRLGYQVVVTIRHPAAFASSLKRLNWPFDFSDLLAQDQLMQDYLAPFRSQMEALITVTPDIVGQASLLWRMVYQVVHGFQQQNLPDVNGRPALSVVRHEDLSVAPVPGYRALYSQLGLDFNPRAEKTILSSSSSENPKELSKDRVHAVRLDSQANLNNWKRRLTADEIVHIRETTAEVAQYYYPDQAWD